MKRALGRPPLDDTFSCSSDRRTRRDQLLPVMRPATTLFQRWSEESRLPERLQGRFFFFGTDGRRGQPDGAGNEWKNQANLTPKRFRKFILGISGCFSHEFLSEKGCLIVFVFGPVPGLFLYLVLMVGSGAKYEARNSVADSFFPILVAHSIQMDRRGVMGLPYGGFFGAKGDSGPTRRWAAARQKLVNIDSARNKVDLSFGVSSPRLELAKH